MNQLCDRFVADYVPRLRPATASMYMLLLDGPKPDPRRGKPRAAAFEGLRKLWGARAVEEITHADVDALHRRVSRGARYTANRLVALLSRLFGLAVRWGWRTDNPAKGVERNQEVKRQRFLTPAELSRLAEALAAFPDRQAADIVALLVLTGARSHEVLALRWDQLDLAAEVLDQAGRRHEAKVEHRVPRRRRPTGAGGHPAGRRVGVPEHLGRRAPHGHQERVATGLRGRGVRIRPDCRLNPAGPRPVIYLCVGVGGRRHEAASHAGAARPLTAGDDRPLCPLAPWTRCGLRQSARA